MENQYSYYNIEEENDEKQSNKKPGKNKLVKKLSATIGFALIFGMVSGGMFYATTKVANNTIGKTNTVSSNQGKAVATLTKSDSSVVESDVSNIVENAMPSIVSITNMGVQEVQNFFGQSAQYQSESAGTGIIIAETDDELLIVTNNHVVADSETLTVTFNDKNSQEAFIKGTDADADLAIISVPLNKIPEDTKNNIAVATIGDSTKVKVGEPAIAIGNALGYGQSVTTGVISAVDCDSLQEDASTGKKESTGVKLLQTDAAINPGNSGGALLNANGEVIGINSAKMASTEVEGMGYAIPISDVSDILNNLMNQKTKQKVDSDKQGFIGIKGFDITEDAAEKYGMPQGVYIEEVTDGGAASKAGLNKGSVIIEFAGTKVTGMEELQKELTYHEKGEEVEIKVAVPENNGEYTEQTVTITLQGK